MMDVTVHDSKDMEQNNLKEIMREMEGKGWVGLVRPRRQERPVP